MTTFQPLSSSVLAGYVYDERIDQLELFLHNGRMRIFEGVPKATVIRLTRAKSAGRFYMTHIRSRYPLVKRGYEDMPLTAGMAV